jgi:hypothetical protein
LTASGLRSTAGRPETARPHSGQVSYLLSASFLTAFFLGLVNQQQPGREITRKTVSRMAGRIGNRSGWIDALK